MADNTKRLVQLNKLQVEKAELFQKKCLEAFAELDSSEKFDDASIEIFVLGIGLVILSIMDTFRIVKKDAFLEDTFSAIKEIQGKLQNHSFSCMLYKDGKKVDEMKIPEKFH